MQFVGAYIAVFITTSTTVLVSGKTVLETAVATTECLQNIDLYSCGSSSGLFEIGLQCGYIQFAENTAAQCTRNGGDFCFGVFSELSTVDAAECSSVNDSSSTCRDFLEATVNTGECSVFNERFSQPSFYSDKNGDAKRKRL